MNDILNKTIVLVLNRNWQAIHVRTPQEAFCMMATNVATDGASPEVLHALGIPLEWAERCEDAAHVGHDGTSDALALRLDWLRANQFSNFLEKITQLGSYGGGNHFGECEVVRLLDNDRARGVAEVFGLRDSCVGFLSHCGSRGFGHALASGQFRALQQKFAMWDIPLPGDDKELVYAPLGTPEADAYLDDRALGANFATVNHLLINALVLEAFQEVIPAVKGSLVYFISHNIARKELLPDARGGFAGEGWVHRKGATRAFPANHPSLKDTPFAETGHPILLPGNPRSRRPPEPGTPVDEGSAFSGALSLNNALRISLRDGARL